MRVTRLEVQNYRGFEELTLELPAAGPTVILGENGAGKSSLLRLAAHACAAIRGRGIDRLGIVLPNDIRRGCDVMKSRVELRDGSSWRIEYQAHDGRGTVNRPGSGPSGVIAWLPADRHAPPRPGPVASPALPATPGSDHVVRDFTRFLRWYRDTEDLENELRLNEDPNYRDLRLETIREALGRFVVAMSGPNLSKPRFSRTREWAANGAGTFLVDKGDVTLALDQLSDGEATMLLTVGELARRLGEGAASVDDALGGPGVVFIDEIEQHLHPKWQRAIIPAFGATFPNIQLVVTTHSPVVLGRVARENVVLLRDFQVVPAHAIPHTYGRDGTSILLDVMGLPPRIEEIEKQVSAIARALDTDALEAARSLLADLELELGPDDSEVIRQRTALQLLAALE